MNNFDAVAIEPRVLYFGTPVVLISTTNEDGSANLAPVSSAWWVDRSCMLGLDASSQTTRNLKRDGDLVLNLVDSTMGDAVDRLALYTGTPVVPAHKVAKGYRYRADKFELAQLTTVPSDVVSAPRAQECPVQLEARVEHVHPLGGDDSGLVAIEARVLRTHVHARLLVEGSARHIDADAWDPLIMKFCQLYGGGTNVRSSRLADAWEIPTPRPSGGAHGRAATQ